MCFKFQSDSINTVACEVACGMHLPLNSNLILLIQATDYSKGFTLNYFKFQSDSINTGVR